MDDYLYQKDLWKPLWGKTNRYGIMTYEKWEILDRKALGRIWLWLALSMTFNIIKAKMTEELMQTLAKLYEKPSTSNKVFLMKHLFNIKMVEGGSIIDHLNDFNTITSQLA